MIDRERALLRAIFAADSEAAPRFQAWQAAVDLDHFPPAHHLLLPMLSARLEALGIQQDARLMGLRRRTWYANQLAWRTLNVAASILRAVDVTPALIGDAACARTLYPIGQLRPIEMAALLVPISQASHALRTLIDHGWQPQPPTAAVLTPSFYIWRAGCPLNSPDNFRLTVKWHALSEWPAPRLTTAIWSQTVPDEQSGALLNLSTTALLISAAARPRQPLMALADAITILRSDQPLDWPWLIETAGMADLAAKMLSTLAAMRDVIEVQVPDPVVTQLQAIAARPRRPIDLAGPSVTGLRRHAYRFRRLAAAQALRPSPLAWLEYVQHHWGLARRRDVLNYLARRLNRRNQS
ncbi:MAG: hypothetical protein KA765_09545 [Thermoflexales bacterium]|nr:hypothetical protein [Thermoflexales bacterium]